MLNSVLRAPAHHTLALPEVQRKLPAIFATEPHEARIGIIKALHASRPELPARRKRTYRFVR